MDRSPWTKTSCIAATAVIAGRQCGYFPFSASIPPSPASLEVSCFHYNANQKPFPGPWKNFMKWIFVFQPVWIKAPSRAVFLQFTFGPTLVVSKATRCRCKEPSKCRGFQTPFKLAGRPEGLKGFSNFIRSFCCWITCPWFTNIYHRPSLKNMRCWLDFLRRLHSRGILEVSYE